MLHITLLLNYNDGVRRCGAHNTDAQNGCKALFGKNLKKFKLLSNDSTYSPSQGSGGAVQGRNFRFQYAYAKLTLI
ncbi:hypothetical protein AB7M23_001712 [Pseudomonas sp. HLS-6 TE3448]